MPTRRVNYRNAQTAQPSAAPSEQVRRPDQQAQASDPMALVHLVTGKEEINLDIPEGALLGDIETTLGIAITGYRRLSDAAEKLKPIIGRILLVISNRRLYRPAFKTFTDYVESVVVGKMGFGRTNAFEALRIAKAFPSLTAAEYQDFGASRLLLATQVTDETDPQYKAILETSKAGTVDEFKAAVTELKAGTTPTDKVSINLRVLAEVKASWEAALVNSNLSAPELFESMLGLWSEHVTEHPMPQAAATGQVQPARPTAAKSETVRTAAEKLRDALRPTHAA